MTDKKKTIKATEHAKKVVSKPDKAESSKMKIAEHKRVQTAEGWKRAAAKEKKEQDAKKGKK